jgi:sec-independent protein translocase protein TatA
MPQVGPAEILVIMVIALLVFGPKRLPEVGRQFGRGLRELKRIQDTVRAEINDVIHADEPAGTPPALPPTASPSPPAAVTYQTSETPPATPARPAPSRFRAPGG